MTELTEEQILQRAMEKAEQHGYPHRDRDFRGWVNSRFYCSIIFSHDFARAYWGELEKHICIYEEEDWSHYDCEEECVCTRTMPAYLWHLQQMVITPNPIDYLRQFLTNEEDTRRAGGASEQS